jgi:hypothetical protein
MRIPNLIRPRAIHKNGGVKMRQLDDGMGDTMVLAS